MPRVLADTVNTALEGKLREKSIVLIYNWIFEEGFDENHLEDVSTAVPLLREFLQAVFDEGTVSLRFVCATLQGFGERKYNLLGQLKPVWRIVTSCPRQFPCSLELQRTKSSLLTTPVSLHAGTSRSLPCHCPELRRQAASDRRKYTHFYRSGAHLEWIRLRGSWRAPTGLEHYVQGAVALLLKNQLDQTAKDTIRDRADKCWLLVRAAMSELCNYLLWRQNPVRLDRDTSPAPYTSQALAQSSGPGAQRGSSTRLRRTGLVPQQFSVVLLPLQVCF